jgi:hypothetical protein
MTTVKAAVLRECPGWLDIGEIDLYSRLGLAKFWCALSLPGVIARGHRKAGQRT